MKFAPIVRVSTEKQQKQGESLKTQRTQIIQYVKSLGGTIPDICWQYSGQEHATPDFERKKLDKLLQDASKGLFEAIIVADASRWSRDNQKSKEGLQVLRDNGIKFFVGTTEYDLFNPDHIFFLGVSAEIGELQARQQNLKSITNRIERARKGIPATGKLPYGRKYDRKNNEWSIDTVKQKEIVRAAERYLSGESMAKIAASMDMNHPSLWKTLTLRCGDEWLIEFKVKKLNIDESVIVKIPPLLPPETIEAIKERSAGNKTYYHGQVKNSYLLSRVVFCSECGNAMFGQTNHNNRRYYRHPRGRKLVCNPGLWVPAQDLEQAAMVQIFAMYGNPELLKAAVERATPNTERIEELQAKLKDLEKDLAAVQIKKDRLVDAVAEGIIPRATIKEKMAKLTLKEESLKSYSGQITTELSNLPDYRRQLSKLATRARIASGERFSHRPENLLKMTFEQKRKLIQTAFAGKDVYGNRLGVYVKKAPAGQWTYEIRGLVQIDSSSMTGKLPMGVKEAQDLLGIDTEFSNINPLEPSEPISSLHCTAAGPPGSRFPAGTLPPGR